MPDPPLSLFPKDEWDVLVEGSGTWSFLCLGPWVTRMSKSPGDFLDLCCGGEVVGLNLGVNCDHAHPDPVYF